MNIYLFELKSQIKSFIIWTTGLVLFFLAFIGGIYPTFRSSADDIMKMLEGFPKVFTAIFGLEVSTMLSFSGFYSFTFVYIALLGAIMAVSVSVVTFAREKRSKCIDFILTKPIKREKIFISKLLSNITILLATNLFFVILSTVMFTASGQSKTKLGAFILASASLLFTQLVFSALGIFFAVFAKKVRSVSGIATAFGFGAFILTALSNIIEKEAMHFIAPLKYFDPYALLINGSFEIRYVIFAALLTLTCIVLAFIKFCKSDTRAV